MIWAEKNSRFTIEFEETEPASIGIDETSFRKRHEYVTIILDKDDDTVIDILNV